MQFPDKSRRLVTEQNRVGYSMDVIIQDADKGANNSVTGYHTLGRFTGSLSPAKRPIGWIANTVDDIVATPSSSLGQQRSQIEFLGKVSDGVCWQW